MAERVSGAGMGFGAGPDAMRVSLGELFPIQRPQQIQVSHRRATLAHKLRQQGFFLRQLSQMGARQRDVFGQVLKVIPIVD